MDYSNEMSEWNYKEEDIAQKFLFFNVLKDGRVHVLAANDPDPDNNKILPTDDPVTGVKIKDVKISPEVAVRVFLPPSFSSGKLPVLLYAHGGAFCLRSAFSVKYTRLITNYVAQSNILAVSVEYRLFPKHSISVCYEDCWTALRWIASHGNLESENFESGSRDPWISDYADLTRIFLGGNSAGATISHTLLTNVRKMGLPGDAKVEGLILVHPYFGENDKIWMYMCPINEGPIDPRMKPAAEDLAALSCERVLVFVGEKDEMLRDAGVKYVEELKKSGWKGTIEFVENKDQGHCFHISKYMDPEAIVINQRIRSFILDENVQHY